MKNASVNSLEQLLGCYFHQDWTDESESEAAALRYMIDHEPEDRLASGHRELSQLLSTSNAEHDLESVLLEEIGCYFDPRSIGMSYKAWLNRVLNVLRE